VRVVGPPETRGSPTGQPAGRCCQWCAGVPVRFSFRGRHLGRVDLVREKVVAALVSGSDAGAGASRSPRRPVGSTSLPDKRVGRSRALGRGRSGGTALGFVGLSSACWGSRRRRCGECSPGRCLLTGRRASSRGRLAASSKCPLLRLGSSRRAGRDPFAGYRP